MIKLEPLVADIYFVEIGEFGELLVVQDHNPLKKLGQFMIT
jgi:hypothetical protein